MNRKLERIAEIVILGAFVFFTLVIFKEHSTESNVSMISEFILWIIIYIVQAKWLIIKFLNDKNFKYVLISIFILSGAICTGLLIKALHLEEMNYRRYYSTRPFLDYIQHFEGWRFKDTIRGILLAYFSATVYGVLRNVKFPNKVGFKKVIPISFFSIILFLVVGFISLVLIENLKEYPVMDYKSNTNNEKIVITEPADTLISFSTIVNHEKPACILFWTQSCGSQRENVLNLNSFKKSLPGNEIDFIYICGEYNRDEDKKNWKDFIISNKIEGQNTYLNQAQFHNLYIDKLELQNGLLNENLLLINSNQKVVYKLDINTENKGELRDKINKLSLPAINTR